MDPEKSKRFWNKISKVYNRMFAGNKAYQKMYGLLKESLAEHMSVLEVGTGSGMVAREISGTVKLVEATDYSEEMIAAARNIPHAQNMTFSVQDAARLITLTGFLMPSLLPMCCISFPMLKNFWHF